MLKWLFNRKQTQDDIEGRCEICKKRLPLILTVLSKNEIRILTIPCKDHPDSPMILWPQRSDIICEQSRLIDSLRSDIIKAWKELDHDRKGGDE